MLTNWGALLATAVLAPVTFLAVPPPPSGGVEPTGAQGLPGTVSADVALRLERDGKLSVTEQVTVPEGQSVTRTVPLRVAAGDDVERVFTVSAAAVEGKGRVEQNAEELTFRLDGGAAKISYTVLGAVADAGDAQDVRWQVSGGWSTDVDSVEVNFVSPKPPTSVTCLAGLPGSATLCTNAQVVAGEAASARNIGLKQGERVDLAVGLEPGTVPANARFDQGSTLAKAFALTPLTLGGLGGLAVLLLGGIALLWYARGRDAKALASDVGPVQVLIADEQSRVSFASPDGVLPGQVGTVVDEHVDVVDVTATVVDLAVRNYVWIEEITSGTGVANWRIVRRNPPDDYLTVYERAVYDTLFAGERDQVLLSGLRGGALDLTGVRDALYTDVVERQWFTRRPDTERTRWWWVGLGLTGLGVVATLLLAFTTTYALLGLAVVVAGIALTIGARSMPARTRRGSALLEQVRGLRGYLNTVKVDDIPAADREMVFSRSLPYAVVLGETDRWLREFATLDSDADGTPGLYWYGESTDGEEGTPDLRRFAAHFPLFLAAVDGVLAEAGHLRSLR
ncbi:hypothetical protein JOF53_005457 [Crossiella equi]|uniref:DUF2207 domain-containing protein n=1 Tax=Crossiella equi TaxID=130796 RepID=A0ABS5AJ39_9PSEU|nr:DUF2207 domain-containing protein [Crossiella equi]MBP2476585.1 hypothetical protein [Crossiella equi]